MILSHIDDKVTMRRANSNRQQVAPLLGCRRGPAIRAIGAAVLVSAALAACAPTITKHGHHFQETDIQQVQVGMSTDQVRMTLGTPATTATVGSGSAFYYISSTEAQSSFFKATEVDRQVVAVYFSPQGSVERVAHYGMKDGKVIDFITRQTPNHTRDEGILKQLFRNLGVKQLGLE